MLLHECRNSAVWVVALDLVAPDVGRFSWLSGDPLVEIDCSAAYKRPGQYELLDGINWVVGQIFDAALKNIDACYHRKKSFCGLYVLCFIGI